MMILKTSRSNLSSNDQLSLDLPFAATKSLTARVGPTPTFTRASSATFVGSNGLIQSAATNIPRFDHTSAGVCRGLLIEESRTNLLTQSGNASLWPNANGTVTNNGSTTAPDGSSNGFLGGIGTANLITPATSSVTGLHTASVFLKRNNTDWARVQVAQGSFAHAVNFWVNLATGAAGTLAVAVGTPTSLSAQVTPFGNSWYRVSITASYPATDSLTLTVISATANNITTRVSGSVYEVWGGQVEAGSFATSYIPTTTGTLARSADVCSITGANFTGFTKLGEGSVVVHGDSYQGTTPAFCQFSNDTNGARSFNFQRNSSTGALEHSDSGAGVMTISASPSFPVKFGAARNQSGGIRLFYNGIAGAISAFTTNGVQTRMLIGNSGIGLPLNGCIRSIKHFKKRLSDAKMQTLTAP
jgi:hypothetical protein